MATKAEILYTNIFDKIDKSLKELIILKGGTGSSKSWSLIQFFLKRLFTCHNRESLIVRETLPALKKTTLADLEKILRDKNLTNHVLHHKSDRYFEYKKLRNKIWYGSTDNPYEYKSSSLNDIWMEESNKSHYESYKILSLYNRAPETDKLPNQFFLSYNPDDEYSWEKVEIIDKISPSDYELIHSTYDDNPFYPESKKRQIEKLKELDPTFYKIYRLGEYGSIKNKIYSGNWDMEWKKVDGDLFYGFDHGWNDPKVLLELVCYDGEIYERQLIYESELKSNDFVKRLGDLGISKSSPIYMPPDDPETKDDVYEAGYNVQDADDSVYSGIMFTKKYKYHIHPESIEDLKETRNYKWKEDRNGKVLDEPVKAFDHTQDARRYGIYTHLKNYQIHETLYLAGRGRNIRSPLTS